MGVPMGFSYPVDRRETNISSGWKSSGMTARDGPSARASRGRDCGMNNKTHKEIPSGSGQLRPAGKRCRTVYIVDNDPAVCHALSLLFANANYAVKSFGSARTLLAAVTEQTTGVLIL